MKFKSRIPADEDPIKLADRIKKGMGRIVLKDYRKLKRDMTRSH